MASLTDLRKLYTSHTSTSTSATSLSPPSQPSFRADDPTTTSSSLFRSGSGNPYHSASTGRRLEGFNPSRLGPTGTLWGTRDLMLARCRDVIRNTPWAASACDNFESQIVGTGIKPKWNLKSEDLKIKIEKEFKYSAGSRNLDHAGLLNIYGLQALVAREVFEGGEIFTRRYLRPSKFRVDGRPLRIPLQFQLIESEQCPIWQNSVSGGTKSLGTPLDNSVRTGIEFDPDGRRTAYIMYKCHPGETMFYPRDGLQFVRIPAENMIHTYKVKRAGLLRGEPHLSVALLLLHELDKYMDATVAKKQIQAMFAGFVKKSAPDAPEIIPPDQWGNGAPAGVSDLSSGVRWGKVETGSFLELLPGEEVQFPTLPQENDLETFLDNTLHQFAVSIGATYEQITGNLRGVNLSSIRAGILDFRRKAEQFIYNVMVEGWCQPVIRWWLDEAVLSGRLSLPGYADEPEQYLDITWSAAGWPWIDPKTDVEAKISEVRAGFTSREAVCAEKGEDAAAIDAQQVLDYSRADSMDLVYDTDPRRILIGRESNPTVPEEGDPAQAIKESNPKPAPGASPAVAKPNVKPVPKKVG